MGGFKPRLPHSHRLSCSCSSSSAPAALRGVARGPVDGGEFLNMGFYRTHGHCNTGHSTREGSCDSPFASYHLKSQELVLAAQQEPSVGGSLQPPSLYFHSTFNLIGEGKSTFPSSKSSCLACITNRSGFFPGTSCSALFLLQEEISPSERPQESF